VRGDGARHVAGFGQFHAALQGRARVRSDRGDLRKQRIVERRPSRAELLVALERTLRFFDLPERPRRTGERVIRRAKLWKQRNRPCEMTRRLLVAPRRRGHASQPEFRDRLGRGFLHQLAIHPRALLDIAVVEQRLREFHLRR
jgi:hypothetical protein